MRRFDVPGAAHLVLDPTVSLLHPAEQIFDAMLIGWERNQISRNVSERSIIGNRRLLIRLAQFTNEYPWKWVPADADEFISVVKGRRLGRGAGSTIRSYQGEIRRFMSFLVNPIYGWQDLCNRYFGTYPVQIVTEHNFVPHKGSETSPCKRPLTYDELQTFFDYLDDRVDAIRRLGKKGAAAACRDSAFFKTVYAWGFRREEATRLDLVDRHHNPEMPKWGEYGSLVVRFGKSVKNGEKRHRTVFTLAEFAWAIAPLTEYIVAVRPLCDRGASNAIFLTERGTRLSVSEADARFAAARDEAGLDPALTMHCLRHSYITHGTEYGYPATFMQEQAGHWAASTTALYTSVSNDFKNHMVAEGVDRQLQRELDSRDETA